MASTGAAWRVAILGGAVATVLAALVLRVFPGPFSSSPVTGTLLVDAGNGQVIAADPEGTDATATVVLQPRPRTAGSMHGFDHDINRISPEYVWWDGSARAFVASSSLTDRARRGGPLLIDSAISYFAAAGQQESLIAASSREDFEDISVSPNGTWMAVQIATPGSQSLRIALARVTDCCRVARILPGWGRPAWSPDSTRVAFQCSPGGGSPQLCVYDVRTGQDKRISTPGIQDVLDPAWSPDNRTVAVVADTGQGEHTQVVAIDASTGAVTTLTGNARDKSYPQFSPSGGQVAYVGAGGIWIVNLQNKKENLLLKGSSYLDIQWVTSKVTGFGTG